MVDEYTLSFVNGEDFNGIAVDGMELQLNCTTAELDLRRKASNHTYDSLYTYKFPYDFKDDANQLESVANYFVKK